MMYLLLFLLGQTEELHEAFLHIFSFLVRGWLESGILCEEIVHDHLRFYNESQLKKN